MTVAGRWGNMSTVYALWLDSGGPIPFESVKYTSHLIFRKLPHLRLCIGKHKNDRWWREMDSDRLDVEEIRSNEDIVTIFESLLQRRYNCEEGPLWFVRFVTSANGNGLVRDKNFNWKHKYVCIFGFHHNFSDGTTNMNFCNMFISLLNSVLTNEKVDFSEVGRFAYPIHDDIARATISYSFLLQLFGIRIYKGLVAYCEYVRNFIRHYPMPCDTDGCTLVLQNELDEVTTERLLKRCKMEGVTLNTVFTAAANIGMLRMILQRDGSVTDTRFDSQQAVNMRRYWPKDQQKNSYGCHISMVDIQIPTTKDDITNFWEYARKVHKIISNELHVERRTLKMQPLSEKLWLAIFVNSWMSKLRLPTANDGHYCITNMGDVSSTFNGHGPVVSCSKILRSVSCHFMQTLCQHTLQTFKGKFYYSLDYYPQKMSVGTARAYASSLMDTLRTVIHMPN
ncbi:hypothetical protein Anas_12390 [Armadillidium nasatum]|uniref:Condensation domain-containing protein n=1 Tax=Armadillidium nasatum TaxID=96803 RepID=A0A5N5TFD4_9CRUS|nr:hypothetical protein Anas_12390 [Armadillidium nasatum]